MKTITITAHDRPDYLRQTLDSLLAQPPELLRSYELLVGIDPVASKSGSDAHTINPFIQAAISVFQSTSQMTVTTVRRDRPLGIDWNNYDLIGRAFAMGSSYNVALEDDTVLAPDALRLCDWHEQAFQTPTLLNLFSRSFDHENPFAVYRGANFCPWGWGCPSERWPHLSKHWMCDERGWDWSINKILARTPFNFVHNPCVSRVRNIGVQGVHHTPEAHALEFPPELTFQHEPTAGDFRLISSDDLRQRYAGREHLMPRCPTP